MDTMHIDQVHFIGVGGVGMSGIARVAFDQGMRVSGTDLKESRYTKQLRERASRCTSATIRRTSPRETP